MLLHHQSYLPQCTLFAPPPPPPPKKKKLWLALFSISLGTAVKPSRNKKKTKVIQNFGGQIRYIMGDVQWRMCYLTQLGIVHRLVLLGFMSVIVLVLKVHIMSHLIKA